MAGGKKSQEIDEAKIEKKKKKNKHFKTENL